MHLETESVETSLFGLVHLLRELDAALLRRNQTRHRDQIGETTGQHSRDLEILSSGRHAIQYGSATDRAPLVAAVTSPASEILGILESCFRIGFWS